MSKHWLVLVKGEGFPRTTHLKQSLDLVTIIVDHRLLREGVRHHFIGADKILEHDHIGEGSVTEKVQSAKGGDCPLAARMG